MANMKPCLPLFVYMVEVAKPNDLVNRVVTVTSQRSVYHIKQGLSSSQNGLLGDKNECINPRSYKESVQKRLACNTRYVTYLIIRYRKGEPKFDSPGS